MQNCLFGDGGSEVFIPANQNQEESELVAQTAISVLPSLDPSPECNEIAPQFLCISIFGLCSNGRPEPYLPSSQQCRAVTEGVCEVPFAIANAVFGPNQLPQCYEFPDVSLNNFEECAGMCELA